MDEKLREKLVNAVEKSFHVAGARDYESGIEQARKLIAFVYEGVNSMKTPDELRLLLDSFPALSKREELIGLFIAQNLPGILRLGLKLAAKKAASDLPGLKSGRPPALSLQQVHEALDYVSKLNRQGCPFEVAKLRTGQRFGCSPRTIERLWKGRAAFADDSPVIAPTIDEALSYLISPAEASPVAISQPESESSTDKSAPSPGRSTVTEKPIPYDESLTEKQPGNRRSSTLL